MAIEKLKINFQDSKIKPGPIHKLKNNKNEPRTQTDQTTDRKPTSRTNSDTICGENCESSRVQVLLYVFFWVIPRHLNFICRCFGTLCLFHLHRQVG